MSVFDLFGTRSVATSPSLFRWRGRSGKPVEGDVGLERFASLPGVQPAEISAAGLTTSDLSQ
jgi:hypothetical protein